MIYIICCWHNFFHNLLRWKVVSGGYFSLTLLLLSTTHNFLTQQGVKTLYPCTYSTLYWYVKTLLLRTIYWVKQSKMDQVQPGWLDGSSFCNFLFIFYFFNNSIERWVNLNRFSRHLICMVASCANRGTLRVLVMIPANTVILVLLH